MVQVNELSESELLSRIVPLLPFGEYTQLGSGDDCAVITAPGSNFVVTTDVLVEDQHFRTGWSTGFEVGARAAAQNLADVAAMGAQPTALVVSLVLPPTTDVDWVVDLASGLAAEVYPTGAGIVGGDLSIGEQLVIAVTAHGSIGGRPVTRAGAQPGDTVAVVGTLGRSAAGFAALETGAVNPALRGEEIPFALAEAVGVYRQPQPPLSAGPLAAQRGATAMMDISDGLVVDAGRLAAASGVTIELNSYGLQEDCAALAQAGETLGVDPLQWVLFGGEDHALLVTFPSGTLVTTPFRVIGAVGKVVEGVQESRVHLDGEPVVGGWDHFRRG